MSKKNYHVVPNSNGDWRVIKEGNEKATSTFQTQKEAISFGREKAKLYETELVIHGKDGKIRDKDSYGNDPFPPKDYVN